MGSSKYRSCELSAGLVIFEIKLRWEDYECHVGWKVDKGSVANVLQPRFPQKISCDSHRGPVELLSFGFVDLAGHPHAAQSATVL